MVTAAKQLDATPLEEQALEIFRELLTELGSHQAAESVSLLSSLERDLGLGSLERVELLVRFESRFSTRLPDEVAQLADTPAEWVRAVAEGGKAKRVKPRYSIEQPAREAPPAPESARTLVEVLRRHAEVDPGRVHIHLLEDNSGHDINYRNLLETATSVAAGLVAAGLRRNETVAIMLPTCADFFYAFFGVMLAGGVAVPIYPPARPDKIEEFVRRQVAILRNAQVRFLIGFDRVRTVSQIMRLSIPSLVEATTVDALRAASAKLPAAGVEPADIALIQYTSGSTGDPKGVVLSQSNLMANIRGIGWAVQVRPTDVGVSWLPLYHDMGLIGSWLFCLYYAVPITILSPLAFLSRPERWLWALHDSRGTLCPAPNFAYEVCARRIPDEALEGLDLRAWRVAINAGEPVLPDTLARFAERFKPFGFRPESYVPCYGLAESSVALAFPPLNRRPVIDAIRRDLFEAEGRAVPAVPDGPGDPKVVRFVANGRPLPGHEIRLLDDQNREVGERLQGRLLFRGPSRTAGYYGNSDATAAALAEDGWMDSGDLAYWAEGELFVTGRSKDLIIKAGRNIVPQEVEAAAADVPGVRRGCVAAFGTVDAGTGTERLVVVAETRATRHEELGKIEASIVQSVDAMLGIPPDKVVLVAPHTIPKTPAGKIRRNETRNLFLNGKLGADSRYPWVQLVRLWVGNLGSWGRLKVVRTGGWLRRLYISAALAATAVLLGTLARLAPGRRLASKIVRLAARCLLKMTGQDVTVQGADLIERQKPVVLIANRASHLDPLFLAAAISSPFLIADPAALASLPAEVKFLLKPLVAPPLNGTVLSPGGTLRERVRHALAAGYSVLVFPDSPAGVPPHLSRFRLDAIHAAAGTSSPIHPVGVRGTSPIFEPGVRQEPRHPVRIFVGHPMALEVTHHRELAGARERVREAIAKLCR